MAVKSPEELYSSLQRGLQATGALSIVKPLLLERKEDLIKNAIRRFNSLDPEKRYSERDALLFVAALAENDDLQRRLEAAESDGRRDGKKLQS